MSTAVDWASFWREVLLDVYIDYPVQLGGPDKTVEIDESKFGKRKHYRGHRVDGVWVFGGVERESGRVFMEAVEKRLGNLIKWLLIIVNKRDAATLLTLIRKWIMPGTTIISDCWRAYKDLDEYKHMMVNHSISFVDAETGANTNTIECIWRHAKESMGSHNRKKVHVPGNLARYVFMKSVRAKKGDFGEEFFRLAGKYYDPRKLTNAEIIEENEDEGEVEEGYYEDIDYFDCE